MVISNKCEFHKIMLQLFYFYRITGVVEIETQVVLVAATAGTRVVDLAGVETSRVVAGITRVLMVDNRVHGVVNRVHMVDNKPKVHGLDNKTKVHGVASNSKVHGVDTINSRARDGTLGQVTLPTVVMVVITTATGAAITRVALVIHKEEVAVDTAAATPIRNRNTPLP